MFYFILKRVRVIDNKDGGGPFKKDGKPTIQFLSFITSEKILGENEIKAYNDENDPAKKKAVLKRMVDNVTSSMVLTPVSEVRDGTLINFGTGLIIHRDAEVPKDFSWRFIAIVLKDKTRALGEEIGNIAGNADFDKFADSFPALIGLGGSPASAAVVTIGKFIFGAIGQNLKNRKDKILASLETSFIEKLHYPNGVKEGENITDSNSTKPSFALDYSIVTIKE